MDALNLATPVSIARHRELYPLRPSTAICAKLTAVLAWEGSLLELLVVNDDGEPRLSMMTGRVGQILWRAAVFRVVEDVGLLVAVGLGIWCSIGCSNVGWESGGSMCWFGSLSPLQRTMDNRLWLWERVTIAGGPLLACAVGLLWSVSVMCSWTVCKR